MMKAACSPITVDGGGEQAEPVGLGNSFLAKLHITYSYCAVDTKPVWLRLDLVPVPGRALADLDDAS